MLILAGGTTNQSTPRRSNKTPKGELLLPKKCVICNKVKFICKTRTREVLVLCTKLRADQTLKMTCQQKTDERMIAAGSDSLVSKKAYYHMTCYHSFTRDFLSNRNTEEQSVDECNAFEKVTIDHFIFAENPDVIELSKITCILESQMREERIKPDTVITSARKNVKRK